MNVLRFVFKISFLFLVFLVANSVLGGLIIALLQSCDLGILPSYDSVARGYSVHFQMLLALSDPLTTNLGPMEKMYAAFDALSSWLVVPAVSGVIIDKVLSVKQELQILKDKMQSRISAYEAIKRGGCPSCGKKLDFFEDGMKFGFVCMNCGESMIEAKVPREAKQ